MMNIEWDWQQVALWAVGFSLATVVATILAVPWVVMRLPQDYFSRPRRVALRKSAGHPLLASMLSVGKNLIGVVLLLLGLVMLVTPGQGLLTLLAGLLLMNFPGKYRLERWLVLRPGMLRGLNWLRSRQHQPPFDTPEVSSKAKQFK